MLHSLCSMKYYCRLGGGGGNEPQGRQGKPPIDVENNLTCHPELRILCRVRTESETRSNANKSECERSAMNDLFAWNNNPRHVSGASHRGLGTITKSQCLISKSDPRTNVWQKAQSTYLININSKNV